MIPPMFTAVYIPYTSIIPFIGPFIGDNITVITPFTTTSDWIQVIQFVTFFSPIVGLVMNNVWIGHVFTIPKRSQRICQDVFHSCNVGPFNPIINGQKWEPFINGRKYMGFTGIIINLLKGVLYNPHCWWKKSCTSWYVQVQYSIISGFHTSQVVQDFSQQQYHLVPEPEKSVDEDTKFLSAAGATHLLVFSRNGYGECPAIFFWKRRLEQNPCDGNPKIFIFSGIEGVKP